MKFLHMCCLWLVCCVFSLSGFFCGAFNICLTLTRYYILAVLGIFRLHSARAVFENAPLFAHKNKGLKRGPFFCIMWVSLFLLRRASGVGSVPEIRFRRRCGWWVRLRLFRFRRRRVSHRFRCCGVCPGLSVLL